MNVNILSDEAKQQEYDPFKRPPDIQFAKNHAKANKFSGSQDIESNIENVQYCPCCGFPVVESQLSLCASQTDLAFNGVGIPLLFQFMQFVAILMSFNFLISGLYNTLENSQGQQCKLNFPICKENYYTKYSLVNSNRQPNQIQLSLDIINIVCMIFFSLYYRRFLNLMALQIDENTISISDYSVQISNLPKSVTKIDIFDYFSQIKINNQQTMILQIKQIILGYDIQDYYKLSQKKIEMELKITSVLAEQKTLFVNVITQEIEQELEEINQKIKQYQSDLELFKFSGDAFITYNTSNQARQIRQFHQQTKIQYILRKIFFFYKPLLKNSFFNKVPYIIRAPEPGDIIWKNLGINPLLQLKYQIFTNLGSVAILVCCFCSILGISIVQDRINNSDSKQSLSLVITLFGLVASFIISFLNNFMGIILKKLVHLEMHSTQTEFNISFANKLGISQFINTAIMPLLVNITLQDKDILTQTWKNGGLVSDVCLIFIMNAIFPWLFNLIDPFYINKLFQRKRILYQDQNCPLTQKEANLIFEGQVGDLSKKYATITKTLLLSFFYAQLIPLGNVISLGFIFINYWVEKYLLIYRYSRGPTIGSQLATEMVDTYIELSILLFSIGNYIWQTLLQEEVHILVYVQLGLGIGQYLLPMDQLFEKCIKMPDPDTPSTYEDNQLQIWDDYGKRNPVTMQNEIESWLTLINKRKTYYMPQQKKLSGYFNRIVKENQRKEMELREQIASSMVTSKFLKILFNQKKIIPLHQEFISRLKVKTKKTQLISDQEVAVQCLTQNQSFQVQDSRIDANYYPALYGSQCAIPIMISRQFVCKYPQFSNFVYPFLQISAAFIYNIYSHIQNLNSIPQLYTQYQWYYGFFAAISHLCIYLQGTILCFQTITMVGILGWHISGFDFTNPNGAYITVQILIVFIVVFFCRRELERNKRLSFLKYRENMKWFQIMDKIIKKWTMCVLLDKSQDQLFLEQQSKAAMQEFQIKTNKQFRIFLRNIFIDQSSSLRTQCGQLNLENILRQILESKQPNVDTYTDLKEQLYYKYVGFHQQSGRFLKIKLIEYYLQDSKMIVMIFQNEKHKLSHEWKKHQAVENYFRLLTTKAITTISQTMKKVTPRFLQMKELFEDFNFYQAAFIWLNSGKFLDMRKLITITTIGSQLKRLLGKSINVEIQCEAIQINSSFQAIIFMCVNIVMFLQKYTNSTIQLKIIEHNQEQVKYLDFIFQTPNFKLPQKLVRLLYQNLYYDRTKKKCDEQGFKKITESYLSFFELMGCPQSSLAMALIKFLLSFYGFHNKIEYQRNELKISVLDLTYFVGQ